MYLNDTTNLNGIYQDIYFNGKVTASTFAANDLLRIVNKYYSIAQSDIRAVSEDFFGEIWKGNLQTTYGGTYPNEVPFPNNYEKIKQIRAAYTPQNASAPLETEFEMVNPITVDQISDPTYTFNASNPYAIIYDSSFFLNPIPTVNVTNGLEVWGIVSQTALASPTDQPNIFTDYQDVITWGSLIDISTRLGNNTLYKQAVAMFKQRREEMKQYAAGRVPDMTGAYVEGQDLSGGWTYPFGNQQMT